MQKELEQLREIIRRYDEVLTTKASKVAIKELQLQLDGNISQELEKLQHLARHTATSLNDQVIRLDEFSRKLDD